MTDPRDEQLEALCLQAAIRVIRDVNEGRDEISKYNWGFGEDPFDLFVSLTSKKYLCFRHYGSKDLFVSEVQVSTHVVVRRTWTSKSPMWDELDNTIREGELWGPIFESFPYGTDRKGDEDEEPEVS